MLNSLKVDNLFVSTVDGKRILKGVNFEIKSGEIYTIMGPNASGKSTLAQVLMGSPGYKVTKGKIWLDGKDITNLSPDVRAKMGLFLAFQYPVEISGVNFAGFLRMAVNEKSHLKVSPVAFRQNLIKKAKELNFNEDISERFLNEGFSGGEKKKSEILQLTILKPKYAILDEPDSGLDIDALRSISKFLEDLKSKMGILLITHYQRILNYIKPKKVYILVDGKIVKEGKADLAKDIEKYGYKNFTR